MTQAAEVGQEWQRMRAMQLAKGAEIGRQADCMPHGWLNRGGPACSSHSGISRPPAEAEAHFYAQIEEFAMVA